jgi:Tn3 transposase DDE domain
VTNCIIYYNATILSNLLAYKEGLGDHWGAGLLKQVSPMAWQHINLHGRFEFKSLARSIDIDAIVLELSQLPITQAIPV